MAEVAKILIVVKTYPLPSNKHKELVCTGGVLEDGRFIRLYPLNFRYRPYDEQFKKYQWVQVEIEKHKNDPRPESYRPVEGARIKILGEPLSTRGNWCERKKYVLAGGVSTMCALEQLAQHEKSLGIIRPRVVRDVQVVKDTRDWKPKWKALFEQYELFGPERKPLEKIPYKFKYVFECEHPGCNSHKMSILDWEIGQLYRSMRDKYDSEEAAVAKVRHKLLNVICDPANDVHFFVGTIRRFGSWVIIGAFYPKRI